ncbi:MAG: hypothetical protein IKZ07_00895 [Akkermansia sp.]|nr:hypothetical protein [Akkermansia sp.]
MAAPKLKVNTPTTGARPKLAVAAAPATRLKVNTGAAPVKKPTLKGANGQAIAPKPEPTPAPEPEITPAPAPATEPATTVVAATPAPAPAATPEADAQAAAEAAAQAEYERQMEEYNRQMEEYNRQMAAYQAQQEAPATQAPEPTEAPAVVEEQEEEEAVEEEEEEEYEEEETQSPQQLSARDAYLQQLQMMAQKKPFHKTPAFFIGIAALVVVAAGCFTYISKENAKREATKARVEATNAILKRAFEINKQQIETYADAQAKGVDVQCSKEDAQCLLDMVVDPFAKDEYGRQAYGASPKQTAQLACLLLAIASEMDSSIDNLIFSTLDKNAAKMDADLFHTLLGRMAVSDNKGINAKFRKLADSVAAKPKWPKKSLVLSYVWESMGLRVSGKDIPDIVNLLKSDELDGTLANALILCLNNIITLEVEPAKKQELGDQIFDVLPEKYREQMQPTLGRACSPKALEFYKSQCESPDNWHGSELFFANYHNDDILPYLMELKEQAQQAVDEAGDDKGAAKKAAAYLRTAEFMIAGVVKQNRDRNVEDAEKLIAMVYDKLNVADDASEEELDASYKQKTQLVNTLGNMNDYPWVVAQLNKLYDDSDAEISMAAKKALERVKENTATEAAQQSKYKSRKK